MVSLSDNYKFPVWGLKLLKIPVVEAIFSPNWTTKIIIKKALAVYSFPMVFFVAIAILNTHAARGTRGGLVRTVLQAPANSYHIRLPDTAFGS